MTEPSGRDLARLALAQARAAAKKRGTAPKRKPVRRRIYRGDGRDPVGIHRLLEQLADANGWERPSAGAQAVIRWTDYAGKAADLAAPERYDAETQTLHLRPASPTAAAALRWQAGQLATAANTALGVEAVRRIRVLTPGPARTATPTALEDEQPEPTTAERPHVRTELPAAFHHARQAMREAHARPAADPDRELRDRHFATSRGTLREPEPPTTLEQPTTRGSNPEQSRQAAIERARQERAGRTPAPPTAFQRTA